MDQQRFPVGLTDYVDPDPEETQEWLDSIDAVLKDSGRRRAHYLTVQIIKRTQYGRANQPSVVQTPYINTIAAEDEIPLPGDPGIEHHIRRVIRWNAAVMVHRANQRYPGIGGHISTYASAATLLEVGFNHFFRGKDSGQAGDHIYIQGHSAPGIYARAFLEGRLTEAQLDTFRRETHRGQGLPSYPHPRLMPDFWEFPTVSMGLSSLSAIYHARFLRYMQARGIKDTSQSNVWCYLGDGECDEPETLGAISMAARENLGNLKFVVNCNLQRLDGPVRGNGKIIQELEAVFRGAGWKVIKVIWGPEWDDLLARDKNDLLVRRMGEVVDGEYQKYSVEDGAYIREHFFGVKPELRALVDHLSDDQLRKLRRGGHSIKKVYNAFLMASQVVNRPTVILAKTVKGWALGEGFEAKNMTHQMKKMTLQELRAFRDRLELPIPDAQLADAPYFRPPESSPEIQYVRARRHALGGYLPSRVNRARMPGPPADDAFNSFFSGSGATSEVSTTMAFVSLLSKLLKDKNIGPRIVPIVPDEARTFGMETLFRSVGIYSSTGQLYEPVDKAMFLHYRETKEGQILEEGITEAGSMASFQAAASAYATQGEVMIPFYLFYSMFGFQRIGDQVWQVADIRGRGFLLGCTAGRTTLNGEGLQHEDGHSHIHASTVPSCVPYDPAFAYEAAVIVRDGLRRMYQNNEDVIYYISLYNENYLMPPMPDGAEEGILRGLYAVRGDPATADVKLLGSGPILNEALRAADLLAKDFGVHAAVYSATSYTLLRREALELERQRLYSTEDPAARPWVTTQLAGKAPVIAASDWIRAFPDQIARWVGAPWYSLGTDGFGMSDTRPALRRWFGIDAGTIALQAVQALVQNGRLERAQAVKALEQFGLSGQASRNPMAI